MTRVTGCAHKQEECDKRVEALWSWKGCSWEKWVWGSKTSRDGAEKFSSADHDNGFL